LIVHSLERRRTEAEQWLSEAAAKASDAVETSPEGLENEPHIRVTNLDKNLKDTVIANEGSSPGVTVVSPPPMPVSPPTAEREFRLKAGQLLDLAPRLAAQVMTGTPNWRDIVDAAGQGLRVELGVSAWLWGEACRVMGREQAALALAIVSTKPADHFTRGAGAHFARMLPKAARGEVRL